MQLTTTASTVVVTTAVVILILSVENVHTGRCSSALLPLFTVKSEMFVSSTATHNSFSFVREIHQNDVHYYSMSRFVKGDYFKNNSPA